MTLLPYPPTLEESYDSIAVETPAVFGWHVYAVQKALNDSAGATLNADGYYGPMSANAVKAFQTRNNIIPDGVVGSITKRLLTEGCARRVDRTLDAPDGMIREMGRAEGGDNISAINPYDPSPTDKGTDCGIIQYRCKELTDGTYDMDQLKLAFSPFDAMVWAVNRFNQAKAHYLTYGWCRNNLVRAEKCALLSHNWPVGANDIAFEGILSNADKPATWVYNSAGNPYIKFLDGQLVVSRRDWSNFYAGIWQDSASMHQGPMAKAILWGQ